MAKIEKYNLKDMLDLQEQYCDMVMEIEFRALEIARKVGAIDLTYIVNDVDIGNFDGHSIYVYAHFVQMGLAEDDDEPKTVDYQFPIDWLFSDDYLNTIEKKPERTPEEEAEYQEYLRLKKKFEGQ